MTWVVYLLSSQLLNNTKYISFLSQVVLFKYVCIPHLGCPRYDLPGRGGSTDHGVSCRSVGLRDDSARSAGESA